MIIFVLAATPFFEIIAIIPIAIAGGLPAIPVNWNGEKSLVFPYIHSFGEYFTLQYFCICS